MMNSNLNIQIIQDSNFIGIPDIPMERTFPIPPEHLREHFYGGKEISGIISINGDAWIRFTYNPNGAEGKLQGCSEDLGYLVLVKNAIVYHWLYNNYAEPYAK